MRFLILSIFLMFLLAGSATFTNFASAYEKENHYWLKIALALNCGFDLDESRLIAIGDFGIDEDPDTQPVRLGGDKTSAKWKWHALPTEDPDVPKNDFSTGNQEIKQRQHELYDKAMKEKNKSMKLFEFGQYLHYEEDKWSHWGYTTTIGHAIPEALPGASSPDSTHANPTMYRYMVFDSMVNLGKLAKSLGIKTKCESDLVPLDTYKSAPEYGLDFPWFSPQEIKRLKDPADFEKKVNQKLKDWNKAQMIDENFQYSKQEGADGVSKNIIRHIHDETKISINDISTKYDFKAIDIDGDGKLKKPLPTDPKKALEVIDGHTYEKTTKPKSVASVPASKDTLNYFKAAYEDAKWNEANAASLLNLNDGQTKILKQLASNSAASKNPTNSKLIESMLKSQTSDGKTIGHFVEVSKKSSMQIKTIAQKQGVPSSDLAKIEKTIQTKTGKPLKITKSSDLSKSISDIKIQDKNAASGLGENSLSALLNPNVNDDQIPSALNEFLKDFDELNLKPNDFASSGMTTEDKLMTLLLKVAENLDKKISEQANKIESLKQNAPSATSTQSGTDSLDVETMQLKRLIDKRGQLFDITRQMLNRYEETATSAIQSMRDGGGKSVDTNIPKTGTILGPKIETTPQPQTGTTESKPQQTNTKPSLTIPKQITQEATSSSGASVIFNVSSQDKEDGTITPTCNPSSGSTFPIGSTGVTCTAKDSAGNSISGSFTVTVRDTTPPVIDPIQPSEGARDDTGVVIYFTVSAHDAVDGTITPNCNYSSGTKFPIGTTVLTCTADDSRGNHASRSLQITITKKESGQ